MRLTFVVLLAATMYLSLSGFECASTEMSTAKLAMQQRDYQKAEANLKKELAARPNNGEAWYLLADVYNKQNKLREMSDAYDHALVATDPALKPEQKQNIYAERFNAWLENYNLALGKYNDKEYSAALEKLDAAAQVRPDYADNIFLRATVYHAMDNKEMEQRTNREYIAMIAPDAEKGLAAGLALGMPRASVESKLGKPFKSKIDSTGGYGYYRDRELYVYYTDKGLVDGWRYFVNSTVPDFIREPSYPLRSGPHYAIGIDAYTNGEKNKASYDEALKQLQFVQRFDLQQTGVGDIIADIYAKTNRTDEAKRSFEDAINRNPDDPSLYINYGSLLLNLKDYAGAIDRFNKVVSMTPPADEKHQMALFNIGAVYKNWASELQKKYGDKPTKTQIDEINDKVRQSVKAFEDYRKVHGDGDFAVLVELGNLYYVLNEKAKLNEVVASLETLKSENANNSDYWYAMSGLYVIKGDTKKSEDALKRGDQLKNH